jgi:hypothetical protein
VKPRNAFIAGCFILAGIGVLMAGFFGWRAASGFPSADLAEPLRQRATNFFLFSSFVLGQTLNVAGFLVGIGLVGFAILTATKNLRRPPSARNR